MAFGRTLRAERKLPANYEQFPAEYWDQKAEHYRSLSFQANNARKRQYAIDQMGICRDCASLIRKTAA